MKITLEIGPDLAKAIKKVADTSYYADVGSNIRKAFGIDFSKVVGKTCTTETYVDAVCPRCLQYSGPMKCSVEIKQ